MYFTMLRCDIVDSGSHKINVASRYGCLLYCYLEMLPAHAAMHAVGPSRDVASSFNRYPHGLSSRILSAGCFA